MNDGLNELTEREKEALRLVLWGHDAKSIARSLNLSIHTVNERLRDARRKLSVTSSREAARLLGEVEHWTPNSVGNKQIGVARKNAVRSDTEQAQVRIRTLILGGTLLMSIIIAAVLLSSTFAGTNATGTGGPVVGSSTSASQSAASNAARVWMDLVDAQRWEESWRSAGTIFKSQLTAQAWEASIQPVRKPLGAVSSRVLQSATAHSSLPGAPAGEYEIVEFRSDFANKKAAVETVILARESAGWKVVGYFIR